MMVGPEVPEKAREDCRYQDWTCEPWPAFNYATYGRERVAATQRAQGEHVAGKQKEKSDGCFAVDKNEPRLAYPDF